MKRGALFFMRHAVRTRLTGNSHKRRCNPSVRMHAVHTEKNAVAVRRKNCGHLALRPRKQRLSTASRPKNDSNTLRKLLPFFVKRKLQTIDAVKRDDLFKIRCGNLISHGHRNYL